MARQSHLLPHHLAHKERKVLQVQRVMPVLREHLVRQVQRVLLDKMVLQDLPGLQVDPVEVALLVQMVQRVLRDLLVLQVQQVQLERKVPLVRRK
jgi:hypothetical protein